MHDKENYLVIISNLTQALQNSTQVINQLMKKINASN